MAEKKLTIVKDGNEERLILDGEDIGKKVVEAHIDVTHYGTYLTYTCRERVQLVPIEQNTGAPK